MAYGGNLLLVHFVHLDNTKCNKINMHFCHAQKYVTNRIWYECTQKNSDIFVSMTENCGMFIPSYFM